MDKLSTDLLIIGSGIAGICAAIVAKRRGSDIILLNKGNMFNSGSSFANVNSRWGMTYAVTDHEREILLESICTLARGTNDRKLSEIVVEDSYSVFRELQQWGAHFLCTEDGEIQRIAPCYCSLPCASVLISTQMLAKSLTRELRCSSIRIFDKHLALELISDEGRFCGCLAQNNGGEELKITAKACVLTSGGNAALYTPNIVDPGLTGDGYSLLQKLGIQLKNMEYKQRVWEGIPLDLNNRFSYMHLVDPRMKFIDYQDQPIVFDNLQHEYFQSRISHVPIANLQDDKVLDEYLMEYIPALRPDYAIRVTDNKGNVLFRILPHYQASNGGVRIGHNGETSLPGLYAAGEVTTGMHGGDRVGGMMITSAMVFAKRSAIHACREFIE